MKLTKNTKLREFIQVLGTDAMRNVIHPNIWVNALFADYKPFIENYPQLTKSNGKELVEGGSYSMGKAILPNWIITDLRFPNEYQAIKDRDGITIRVNRTYYTEDKKYIVGIDPYNEHPSETALDNAEFDYVIDNNSDIATLIEKVKKILIKESIL